MQHTSIDDMSNTVGHTVGGDIGDSAGGDVDSVEVSADITDESVAETPDAAVHSFGDCSVAHKTLYALYPIVVHVHTCSIR